LLGFGSFGLAPFAVGIAAMSTPSSCDISRSFLITNAEKKFQK